MSQKKFNSITAFVFLIIAVLHAARVIYAWKATIGGWAVPMWISYVAFIVAAGLSYYGLQHSKN